MVHGIRTHFYGLQEKMNATSTVAKTTFAHFSLLFVAGVRSKGNENGS